MPPIKFAQLFKSPGLSSDLLRDKFLSRLFGIFSEEIVRIWCRNPLTPYEDLGRPTIRASEGERGNTLDFTFQSKVDGLVYVGEQKCELEYEKHKYLALTSASQLYHHAGEAFTKFRQVAQNPECWVTTVKGSRTEISGSILVWGSVTDEGRKEVMDRYSFKDVLSLEQVVEELNSFKDEEYLEFIEQRSAWCHQLFSGLGL